MKHNFTVALVDKTTALAMVQKYHYSNTLPKLNKYFLGVYENGDELKGVITLGWGTRPRHTIQKLFPSLDTKDYLEIGRMCMTDEMERNSESQMIKACIKWIKQNTKIKVLFTWADGMLGKPGYVYQAANFVYAGKTQTDIYMKDGIKIHPRQTRKLFGGGESETRKSVRPTVEQQKEYRVEHYRGYQYKYLFYVCGKFKKRELMREAKFSKESPPKGKDLKWEKYNLDSRKWEQSGKPPYKTDFSKSINMEKVEKILNTESELSLF